MPTGNSSGRNSGKFTRGYVYKPYISEFAGAIVRTAKNAFQLIVTPNQGAPEEGPSVYWTLPIKQNIRNASNIVIDWSDLTTEELQTIEAIFAKTLELARVSAALRDAKTREAIANGDDTYARIYRPASTVIIREWLQSLDGEGLLDRYPTDAPIPGSDEPADESDKYIRETLAELDQEYGKRGND